MVYNKKTKKFYLGSSIDFGLRVSYYNRDLKNYFSNSRSSLYSSFIEDIKTNDCSYSDFFFIPLISFEVNSIKFEEMESLKNSVSTSSNSTTRFLETIEFNAINHFMVDKIRSTQIYNRGATGQFVAGNTFRPPTSGTRPKPVDFVGTGFAFESVLLAAEFLGVDRRTIRNKIGRNFEFMDPAEFDSWPTAKKIIPTNADRFDKSLLRTMYKQ